MTTIIFKIDGKLKRAAMKRCKEMGISMSDFYRLATLALVRGDSYAQMIVEQIKTK
jgi:antitoxin component of RelBE/YafQ-DinJ toxin-antitoxin module